MPVLSGADLVKALARLGFEEVSQKGSHRKMRHPDGRLAIVPMHRELAAGTLRGILRLARVTVDQLG